MTILFLQTMVLPCQTNPGQTVTVELDTDDMDKQKKSYILGFISAVGQCTEHAFKSWLLGFFTLRVT
jgi:hypothetical protein